MNSSKEGVILINKPEGLTSHDVVDFIRKRFKIKKVGHAGTLDPMATGLLIILLGSFTKKSLYFSSLGKEYKTRMMLGISTDTGDKEGKIVKEKNLSDYKDKIGLIDDLLKDFTGEISQIPPMFSAKKIRGKKLYEFARRGISIQREPRRVMIDDIKIIKKDLPFIDLYIKCSKGTYVRQIATDVGERLGCGAHLVSLERIAIGGFSLEKAISTEELKKEEKKFYENILQPE